MPRQSESVVLDGPRQGDDFERWTRVYPSKDGEPWSTRLAWYLRGPLGTVQFVVRVSSDGTLDGWDVGAHSTFERDWGAEFHDCDLVPGGHCWYDGSGLMANDLLKRVYAEGDEAIWAELVECYDYWLTQEAATR